MVSHYPKGRLESACHYTAGLPEALQEEWYPNGRMFHRGIAVRGNGVSEAWTWYCNGQMGTHSRYVDNRQAEVEAWDATGRTVDLVSLPPINDTAELRRLFEGARETDR